MSTRYAPTLCLLALAGLVRAEKPNFLIILNGAGWAVRTPTGKYLSEKHETGVAKLYDMASDPYESVDLMGRAPELQAELAAL